jgi:antitoxin component YwqK of YwqJK toxin-antitoxin module
VNSFSGELTQELETGRVVIQYVSGKKHGPTKFFDHNGLVLSEITYKNDQIDGEVKQYGQSGSIISSIMYREGIQHGPFISFYENGMKQMESFYSEGKIDGASVIFDEFGDVISKTQYHAGLKHGKSVVYYPKSQGGGIFELSYYENGKLTGNMCRYYGTGEIMSVTPYTEGKAQAYPKNFSKTGEEI